MKAMVWNCRGLGGPFTVYQIKDSRRIHHPNIVFLSETKKPMKFAKTVCRKLGYQDRWHLESPNGTRGGLLLLWDNLIEIKQIVGNEFFLQVELKGVGISDWGWFIFAYLITDRRERRRQWEFLEDSKGKWGNS
ncbi:non-LTR retroelement reverse transcriptase-like protein [Striga asiatica]|uniref:Non-LTR retroelement reverse transcriptase-like protein n=1 Tax=Striga asiatica TaxID=4170 RepID=A0A5A7REZ8_STRAF|nr:non-LTR retroelement reverse transcriptase-like protein [Striga asiatica]